MYPKKTVKQAITIISNRLFLKMILAIFRNMSGIRTGKVTEKENDSLNNINYLYIK